MSCCAVLCGACLRMRGAVMCCCTVRRFRCGCVLSWCAVSSCVSLCRPALCWFCRPVQPCLPPPCSCPCCLAVPCVLSCLAVSCRACGAVLCCAGALVLAVPFVLCCCCCLVPWCIIVRCAVALGVLWCGGVALLCGVVFLGALVPGAVPYGAVLLCVAVLPAFAVLFLYCLWFFNLFFPLKTTAVCFYHCFVVYKTKQKGNIYSVC